MKSGIVEKEAPIHLSNVLLYDERLQRGTRVGMRVMPDGKTERVSKASGETIAKGE
jgi:large subunit ribosomal protein L24